MKVGLTHVQTGDSAQGRDSGALKIYGEGVQAVIGGTMMQYVSLLLNATSCHAVICAHRALTLDLSFSYLQTGIAGCPSIIPPPGPPYPRTSAERSSIGRSRR